MNTKHDDRVVAFGPHIDNDVRVLSHTQVEGAPHIAAMTEMRKVCK